jgi:hypothetical protein
MMGLFGKKKDKASAPAQPLVEMPEVTYGEEQWVNGMLRVQKIQPDGYTSLTEPPDIVDARKALKRVKRAKLSHSKSQKKNIERLVGNGDQGGLGELVREPSTSGECHYRVMYKGKDVGLMPSNMVNQIRQCYGMYDDDETPEHVPCKVVLRVYDDGGGWSAANIL